ncbi:transposase domain-containing protein [Victivallis sp. Marseille-Q1083]|uniref:transposase domain-containing protein n=1 Tax=Victivallis sp. Marseille-Q1083 TaxID=2717288 RepID=UPI0034C5DEDD
MAILFSFAAACKANAVNYRQWLEDVLIRINTTPASQIDSLLPQNWKAQPIAEISS